MGPPGSEGQIIPLHGGPPPGTGVGLFRIRGGPPPGWESVPASRAVDSASGLGINIVFSRYPAFIKSRSYGRGVLKDESKDSPFKLPTLSPKAGLGTFKPPPFVRLFVVRSGRRVPVPRWASPPGWEPVLTSRAFDTASKPREGWRWLPASLLPRFRSRRRLVWWRTNCAPRGGGAARGAPTPTHCDAGTKGGSRFSLSIRGRCPRTAACRLRHCLRSGLRVRSTPPNVRSVRCVLDKYLNILRCSRTLHHDGGLHGTSDTRWRRSQRDGGT